MEENKYLVTFICTANVCRSPMAEGLLRHALQSCPRLMDKITVTSAGVSAHNGDAASPNAIEAMKKAGIDISGHRSKLLSKSTVDASLAIICMTNHHRVIIKSFFNPLKSRLYLMRDFLPNKRQCGDIADPFGQSLDCYENTRDNMLDVIPEIITFLKKELNID